MAFVEFEKVSKIYHTGAVEIPALRDATFQVEKGEICVIVGASGAGKTTLLNILGGMDTLTGGTVKLDGRDISRYDRRQLTEYRRQLCPHPLDAAEVLREVGLGERMKNFPAQLSGGEQQRVAIARALAKNPKLLLCDEPISALDVSIQAQIVNLLLDLREQKSLTYLLISHDLSMVRHLSDRILVMYLGEVVEESTAQELYTHPLHPYTKALIAAIPIPDPKVERARPRSVLQGQVPSPVDPPPGCRFAGRCPYATDRCRAEKPELCDMGGGHRVACHLCR